MTRQEVFAEELLLELPELVEQCVDGTASEDQIIRLNRLMVEDRQARMLYARYVHTLCGLQAWSEYPLSSLEGDGIGREGFPEELISYENPCHAARQPLDLLSGIYHGTVGFFSQEVSLSMLIATVIMASALYLAWVFNISHHQQLAEHTHGSPEKHFNSETVYVGRITGMKDCQWAKPNTQTVLGASVSLEREYALSSGLMEITYTSGAKVILEGPCTFKVDSNAGGFLTLGKLIARVETKGSGFRIQGSDSDAVPSSLILPPTSFVIRTPTAIVTDLGTEFGVEVHENGDAETHVFQGEIEVKVLADDSQKNRTFHLGMGESAQVAAKGQGGSSAVVTLGKADASAFPIRPGQLSKYAREKGLVSFRRWQAFRKELTQRDDLLSYYDFQPDGKSRTVLRNIVSSDRQHDGRIENAAWVSGRFPGKSALKFNWGGGRVRLSLPQLGRQMTLIARVRFDALPHNAGLLMSYGWWEPGLFRWQILADGRMAMGVAISRRPHSSSQVVSNRMVIDEKRLNKWIFLAVVCDLEAEQAVFYADGEPVGRGSFEGVKSLSFRNIDSTLGDWHDQSNPFPEDFSLQGSMDELMIFGSALSEEEIRHLWKGGDVNKGP